MDFPRDVTHQKAALRKALRRARLEHAASLPPEVSALVFRRPPAAVLELIPEGAAIGLYREHAGEAPASAYRRFFHEAGHRIALPRIHGPAAPMTFHLHTDPFAESDLVPGRFGLLQPAAEAGRVVPEVLIVPVIGFTRGGERLGQGGGFFDRWLATHPRTIAIGLAWDVQEVDALPGEEHDIRLTAIVTPTRLLGPF